MDRYPTGTQELEIESQEEKRGQKYIYVSRFGGETPQGRGFLWALGSIASPVFSQFIWQLTSSSIASAVLAV